MIAVKHPACLCYTIALLEELVCHHRPCPGKHGSPAFLDDGDTDDVLHHIEKDPAPGAYFRAAALAFLFQGLLECQAEFKPLPVGSLQTYVGE